MAGLFFLPQWLGGPQLTLARLTPSSAFGWGWAGRPSQPHTHTPEALALGWGTLVFLHVTSHPPPGKT